MSRMDTVIGGAGLNSESRVNHAAGERWSPLRPTVGERGSIPGSRAGSRTDPPGFQGETLEKAKLRNPLFTRGRTTGTWKRGVQARTSEIACWEGAAIGLRGGRMSTPTLEGRIESPRAGRRPAQTAGRHPRREVWKIAAARREVLGWRPPTARRGWHGRTGSRTGQREDGG